MSDIGRLPVPIAESYDWQMDGACRGMDSSVFFHPASERDPAKSRRIAQAKKVCAGCPVIEECRQHALTAREPYGVWGGLSEEERASALGLRSMRYPARNRTRRAVSSATV